MGGIDIKLPLPTQNGSKAEALGLAEPYSFPNKEARPFFLDWLTINPYDDTPLTGNFFVCDCN